MVKRFLVYLLCITMVSFHVAAQDAYKNPSLSADDRARDLLSRMTLEEKISQMVNSSPAISRLNIPAVDWWNEALHGVARAGKATVFPQTIGLAATFDTIEVLRTYSMISDEARAKHHDFKSHNQLKRYGGLTFWTPNINIFRDPRWGRGQETYGEDPFLTSRMGVVVVRGLQGDGTQKYDKVHACAKHYAVHSGPEWNRHSFDVDSLSGRNLWETYLPAFKSLVKEAGVKEVMCAYNRFDGEPCCSSKELLGDILRNKWGYDNVVVSDCGAIDDFFRPDSHLTNKSAIDASADAVISGTDISCGNTYKSLPDAIRQGLITETQIDRSVFRLLRARFQLGMFDDDSLVSWSHIPYSVVESEEHIAQARKMAQESIVLLKNKNRILPLQKNIKLAIVGPNAADSAMLWANYNGTPTRSVTILQGIVSKLKPNNFIYEKGCDYVSDSLFVSRMNECSIGGQSGWKADFWNREEMSGAPVVSLQMEGPLRFDADGHAAFAPGVNLTHFSSKFETVFRPQRSAQITIKITADDEFNLKIDGKEVLAYQRPGSLKEQQYVFDAQKGKAVLIELNYVQKEGNASLRVDMGTVAKVDENEVADNVKNADVIVFVGGISAALEGEEMNVDLPGFRRGDRTRIELPDVQRRMLQALKATGKPVILVLCSGSSVALPWEDKNLDGIIAAWYPGQQGGNAVADVLFGDYNPAGRLPVTFYAATSDLPDYEDYDITRGRTYRYFKGKPVYPFGFGLSYTSFVYKDATLTNKSLTTTGSTKLNIQLKNTGNRDGDEVVQVYISNRQDPNGPIKSLRGFKRVHLKAGQTMQALIDLPNSAFEFYGEQTGSMDVRKGVYDIWYGPSSDRSSLKQITLTIQ